MAVRAGGWYGESRRHAEVQLRGRTQQLHAPRSTPRPTPSSDPVKKSYAAHEELVRLRADYARLGDEIMHDDKALEKMRAIRHQIEDLEPKASALDAQVPREKLRNTYVPDWESRFFFYNQWATKLVWMDPNDFLRLSGDVNFDRHGSDSYEGEKVEPLMDRMRNGQELDPLFLDVQIGTNQVYRHEGRHRSVAARRLGIEKVPVLIFALDPEDRRMTDAPDHWDVARMKPQQFR